MSKRLPIFYSALLLTSVNLLLRLVGTSFQVYLSGRIGASGIGLLQLVMSVGSLSMIAGIAGIRTTTMYLTAEELGKRQKQNIPWVLSSCFFYSILCSGMVAALILFLAPAIAEHWIDAPETVRALRLFAAFLPLSCLCSVMTGYFTAANRIGTLAVVEVAEQLVSIIVTMSALFLFAGNDPVTACQCVILGSCMGSCLTLCCLVWIHRRENIQSGARIPVANRLLQTAIPLAQADILRSGITTTENLMVPKRLARNVTVAEPLAAFGTVSGMVFPVLMFPACILFGLAELLIPELARCNAAGSRNRIRYLVRRSLKLSMLYGLLFSGLMFLLSNHLCMWLYHNPAAGGYLKLYALLIPMLYCDAITDAITKGLGQQKICVRYNILTSAMDVAMLYFLLPEYGMIGYFISFLISHLVNFLLSLRLLLKISGLTIPAHIPMLSAAAALISGIGAAQFSSPAYRILAFSALLFSLLYLLRIICREDFHWISSIITGNQVRK